MTVNDINAILGDAHRRARDHAMSSPNYLWYLAMSACAAVDDVLERYLDIDVINPIMLPLIREELQAAEQRLSKALFAARATRTRPGPARHTGGVTREEIAKAKTGPWSDVLDLNARGKALCPFHEERQASFSIHPATGFGHCFACGWHGDIIKYIMDREGIGFVDAVKKLN